MSEIVRKIHRSKFASCFCVFVFVIHIVITIVSAINIINAINERNYSLLIIFIMIFVILTVICILNYFLFNRMGAIITFDKENKVLIRKGYLFGYRDILKVEDIIDVKKVTLSKDNTYYILIDNYHTSYEGIFKKSFFSITCNKESKGFIEQFWEKPLDKFWN